MQTVTQAPRTKCYLRARPLREGVAEGCAAVAPVERKSHECHGEPKDRLRESYEKNEGLWTDGGPEAVQQAPRTRGGWKVRHPADEGFGGQKKNGSNMRRRARQRRPHGYVRRAG